MSEHVRRLDEAIKRLERDLDLGGGLFYDVAEGQRRGLVLFLSPRAGARIPLLVGDTLDELTAFVEGMRKTAYLIKNREAEVK